MNEFDKNTFPKENYDYLEQYCYRYRHIWEK